MSRKSPNLRFLLALGSTKIVVLQNANDVQVYTQTQDGNASRTSPIEPGRIAEALTSR